MRFHEYALWGSSEKIILRSYHSAVDPGTREYQEHHHTECELSLFLSGSGIYQVGEKEYSFSSGDMFLFGSHEVHCITDIKERLNLLNIQFEPQILWERPENTALLSLFFSRSENFSNKFTAEDTKLASIILAIETELSTKAPAFETMAQCLLFSALTHILRNYDYTDKESLYNPNNEMLGKLKTAISYIDANIEKNLTLSEIAKTAFMSQNYFSSVFKKYNGISPWEYITIKRVEKAIHLLRTTSHTKLEIAEKCGFSSSSNFYKAFEKITGKTPGDFKKEATIFPRIPL